MTVQGRRRGFVIAGRCVVVVVLVSLADVCLTAYAPDVRWMKPLHTCKDNFRRFADGAPSDCPLSTGLGSYVRFDAETEVSSESEKSRAYTVVAAENELRHRIHTSLIFPPIKFAVVLLGDGRTVRWAGSEARYAAALDKARASQEGRLSRNFFMDSSDGVP